MQISVDRDADIPIYRQIVAQIREQIRTGALPGGFRLPPVRRVATDLGLTRLTVHSAYAELQAQGLVESYVGRGTFVASGMSSEDAPRPRVVTRPEWASQGLIADLLRFDAQGETVSFAQAFPAPETAPVRELGRALQSAIKRPGALEYGPIQGLAELRERIAALLLERGVSTAPEAMLITAGAQQGIDTILRTCTEPGDTIAVEAPTYPGVLELAALRQLHVVGVPSDHGGIRVDALEAACVGHRPRLLYLVPTCGNPTGRILAHERRAAILNLSRAHGVLVVEDDIYGLLTFNVPAPPALKSDDRHDTVLYLTSFSKMLAPALRLGALVAPAPLLPRLAAAKGSSDLVCSSLLQLAVAEYLRQDYLLSHLRAVRGLYQERCNAMHAALGRYLPDCVPEQQPEGGLSMWVRLPDGAIERDVVTAALEAGVAVVPGRAFFAEPQRGAFMRLSFSTQSPERIEQGVIALQRALRAHLSRGSAMLSLARATAGPLV